ncbi:hypothetical protein LAZ67_5003033 [Cordylochernes scorpioides]|uniref:Reverse transcriptase domain-containing protein n=1 Tax=Cordylochernes scorpioides TaxID=51811 RepID=A0ABY6KI35_9ARAC|nr:hypothetical protein LAZ67_5003033 [Cordylochernes scorpioides]
MTNPVWDFDSNLLGIYLPNYVNVHLLLYADDIVLIGESKNNFQIKIKMLKIYFERNLLTLNENKSKIMVFRNGGRLAQNDKWYWGEQQLSVTTKYQYLGYPLTTANSLNKVSAYYKGKKALATIGAVWKVLTNSTLHFRLLGIINQFKLPFSHQILWCNSEDVANAIEQISIIKRLNCSSRNEANACMIPAVAQQNPKSFYNSAQHNPDVILWVDGHPPIPPFSGVESCDIET